MNFKGSFGGWLKQRRKALDLTQAELADQVACALTTIRKIEADLRRPSKQIAEHLADVLAISDDERATFIAFARHVVDPPDLSANQIVPPIAPSNLPTPSTPFLGREDELAQIATHLANPTCRLLTLVGVGGIGKTRLAIEAARALAFADGVYFVALQPLDSPDSVIPAIAEALQFQFYSGTDPKQQLFDHLRKKSLLLLLDNFEHLLDCAELVSDLLTDAPNLKVLATSREALNLQEEWVYWVKGMSFPPKNADINQTDYSAVDLFVQSARRMRTDFSFDDERAGVIRICQLVEGMPLGIELASAWVRTLSCMGIAGEIERSLDILATSTRNVSARHRTMRATLDHSWMLLTENERQVFEKLSVFRGGLRKEAALTVAGATLPILSALVDKSFLRVDVNGRYDIHELLRQYGEEQSKRSGGIEAARDAHSRYYADFLQQKWQPIRTERQAVTLNEIEVEFENIRTAWQRMSEQGNTTELSKGVYSLWYFGELRGRTYEVLTMLKQAEDALRTMAAKNDVDRAIAQMLSRRGFSHLSIGKLQEAIMLIDEALPILERVGSLEDRILALFALCNNNFYLRDMATLKQNVEHMFQLAQQQPDPWLLVTALYWRALAEFHYDNDEMARQIGQQGFELVKACGDILFQGAFLGLFGRIAHQERDYSEAKRCYEKRLQLFETIGDAGLIADSHLGLGMTAFYMEEYSVSAFHYQQGLRSLAGLGESTNAVLFSLIGIAVLLKVYDPHKAVELLTFVVYHPEALQRDRERAAENLHLLQAQLPSESFAVAQERGKLLELNIVTKQLIAELGQLAQNHS